MKKRKRKGGYLLPLSSILLLLFVALFASCSDEEEKFENIDFKTSGITLSPQSGNQYYAEADCKGGDITITATDKNASNGFLSEVKVGDFVYEVTVDDRNKTLPYTICEKEWGKVELTSVSPHAIHIALNENTTGNSINYELIFGAGYKTSKVLITQLKANK